MREMAKFMITLPCARTVRYGTQSIVRTSPATLRGSSRRERMLVPRVSVAVCLGLFAGR
jgi:hypothetical protein